MQEVRRSKIAELVNEKGIVRIEELAKMFGISGITIHRDLQYLENKGILRKLRGGAIATPSEVEVQFSYRTQSCIEEKKLIGMAAAQLIEEGDVVIMDGSTTCLEVAKKIKNMLNLTVFTNNPFIMYELMHSQGIVLYFIGGLFSRDLECFVGAEVEEYISKLHITKGVFGASAISPKFGITGPYPQLVSIQREIIKVSTQVIIVADYTKFGKVALEKTADIDSIDYLVTDSKIDKDIVSELEKKSKVIIAK